MIRLMKYELRKMRTPLLIMLLILAVLQAGFMLGEYLDRENLAFICLWLWLFSSPS